LTLNHINSLKKKLKILEYLDNGDIVGIKYPGEKRVPSARAL